MSSDKTLENRLRRKASMDTGIVDALEATAREAGANTRAWFGMIKALPIQECERLDVMDKETMQWEQVRPVRQPVDDAQERIVDEPT